MPGAKNLSENIGGNRRCWHQTAKNPRSGERSYSFRIGSKQVW